MNEAPELWAIGDQAMASGTYHETVIEFTDPDPMDSHAITIEIVDSQSNVNVENFNTAGGTSDAGALISPESATMTSPWKRTWMATGIQFHRDAFASGYQGKTEVTLTVTDNGEPALGASETFAVTVTDTNHPPVISAIARQYVQAGDAKTVAVYFIDEDAENTRFERCEPK